MGGLKIGKWIKNNANSAWDDISHADFAEIFDPLDVFEAIGFNPIDFPSNVVDGAKKIVNQGIEIPEIDNSDFENKLNSLRSTTENIEAPESQILSFFKSTSGKTTIAVIFLILILLAFQPQIEKFLAKNKA